MSQLSVLVYSITYQSKIVVEESLCVFNGFDLLRPKVQQIKEYKNMSSYYSDY